MSGVIHVKVRPNRFELRDVKSGKTATVPAPQPFTTDRLLVGQFNAAEAALREGLRDIRNGKWSWTKPTVVVQPMEMVEGGLSEVEESVLRELAAGSGAGKAVIWVGSELTDAEVLERAR